MLKQINIDKIVEDLLPVVFKAKYKLNNNLYQLIKTLVKGCKNLYDDFKTYELDTYYELYHTGQVYSLEHQLNDYFNLPFPTETSGSIWIEDIEFFEETFLFNTDEESELYFEETFLFNVDEESELYFEERYIFSREELDDDYVDFIVNYPDTITDTDYIISIINKYKLAGYKFRLNPYTII